MTNEADNEDRAEERAPLLREFFPAPYAAGIAIYCGMIFYLSSLPSPPFTPPFPHFDKVVHFFLFGGLGAVVAMGLRKAAREYSVASRVVVPIVFCFFYGLSDEIHQSFTPERMYDRADLAADVLGAAVAAGLILTVFQRTKPHGLKNEGGET